MEDPVDNVGEMTEADDEFELRLHIGDGQVDLLDRDRDTGVDRDETSDVGIEIDVCLEVVDVELDAPDGEVGNVEEDVGRCVAGGAGAAA